MSEKYIAGYERIPEGQGGKVARCVGFTHADATDREKARETLDEMIRYFGYDRMYSAKEDDEK